jgi:hypothetical protein
MKSTDLSRLKVLQNQSAAACPQAPARKIVQRFHQVQQTCGENAIFAIMKNV